MRANAVREAIRVGRPAVNAWISSDGTYAAETLSYCGYDSITVDAQHGMFGRDAVVRLLQAISAGPAMPMVRSPRLDFAEIGWLLDAGAFGIICPSIDTADDAARLVAACRYPPAGLRSFGPSRALLYGGSDYVRAVDEVLVWAMIESAEAMKNLDEILKTPGLDGVYVGPNDLALSMGLPVGGSISGAVEGALGHVVRRAHENGKLVGVFCVDGTEAGKWAARGCDLVTPGNDMSMLKREAANRINLARGASEMPKSDSGY